MYDECSFRLRTRRGRQRPAPLGPPPGRRTLSTVARPLNNLWFGQPLHLS